MHLYLSSRSPLHAVYTNEDGQVMYKVETTYGLGNRTSTISCVVPHDIPRKITTSARKPAAPPVERESTSESGGEEGGRKHGSVDGSRAARDGGRSSGEAEVDEAEAREEVDMRDRFALLAQIEHKTVTSSIMRFGGDEVETKTYFKKKGWGWYGRNRVFTAPDGREYKWLLKMFTSELILYDPHEKTKTHVAKFHPRSLGIIRKAHPAYLEIFPAGEHMVETILITFIYIEKLRKDKERASRSSGGGP
ncbi:hypothetical protein Hypma_013597 [Hypsizygus marmoreus]|uniref:DUF6593 domain-containing protein n=1 Tax=Hypsizygus marmoreus TaxID=39966 RepID=A0A369JFB8_HYPMA|nr:hypothetical protein Hypma_013597 [Hypsizygus marmoreus]